MALNQNSIRERQRMGTEGGRQGARVIYYPEAYYLSAGVIILRMGGPARKKSSKFFSKNLTVPKIDAQCRKRVIQYLFTLPNAIAYLNTCIPYLNTCIAYVNTLSRLSALGSISYYIDEAIPYLNTWKPYPIS